MTRAVLARVPAPLALRRADNGMRMVEPTFPEVPAGGSVRRRGLAPPAKTTATATLAIPLDGLTLTAPQPEMLSQKNVESV